MKIIYVLIALLTFLGCSTPASEKVDESFEDKIILKDLVVTDDGVRLSWSELVNTSFDYYSISRRESPDADWNSFGITLDNLYNQEQTNYLDTDFPFSSYVEYRVVGKLFGGNIDVVSNAQKITNPEVNVLGKEIDQVLNDETNSRLYFVNLKGVISIFDLNSNEIVKRLDIHSPIGYSDIAVFNNQSELYVPREDGWLYIYNADNLNLIDRIDIGSRSTSVVSSNNYLYISTERNWPRKAIRVFNRKNTGLIEETGDNEFTRLRKWPNSQTELLEITLNLAPVDLDFWSFSQDGKYISHNTDSYHGDYPLDANIFAFFPDRERFITGREGAIYTKDLLFQSRLPKGYLDFSSFEFFGFKIYAGCSNEKSVQLFDINTFQDLGFIKTKSYPKYLFKKESNLIIIGRSSNTHAASLVLEQIQL